MGTKVLGMFAPEERKFHGSEWSTEAKVLSVDFSLPGTKVQRNEKAYIPLRCSKDNWDTDRTGILS